MTAALIRNFSVVLLVWLNTELVADSSTVATKANVPVEITFSAQKNHDDPFNTIQLDVLFTDPNGGQKLVPAFWDGGDVWKVRYSSPVTGTHRWQSQCNDNSDGGLHAARGVVQISRYRGNNPLFKHGQIQVAPDKRHLQHADGTLFFWLGDTWWMGLCNRIHFPDEFKQLADDRKQKGFNVIQIVAGLYPDMPPFDLRGANESGFPWQTNYTSIRPEYFDAADKRLWFLVEQEFTPMIVGAWGYFLPMMGEQRAKQHWRELIARYGSWPVVWCVAGEANLPWYLVKNFPYEDPELVKGWTEIARYIRATDPFHRLLTIHPTGKGKQNGRNAITDPTLIDFDFLQTQHGQAETIPTTLKFFNGAYKTEPPMPVINGEPCYEMLQGKIPARWPRATFWICMMNGAAGHTYGANGIWQCNREGQPHGNSPTGTSYGDIPWSEAMQLPGSRQIGDSRKFLERFPWNRCVPQPDSVAWNGSARTNRWGNWIWFPEGNPAADAPCEPRFFRRTFDLSRAKARSATLRVSCDDTATVWFNGKRLGSMKSYKAPEEFDVTKLLQRRKNVIAIEAQNIKQDVPANPASLIAIMEIQTDDGTKTLLSDADWRVSQKRATNWQTRAFDDSVWTQALVTAPYGGGPWERFGDESTPAPPLAMGIGDELKIIYAITPQPLFVRGLRPKAFYRVTGFNPVTGEIGKLFRMQADAAGVIRFPAPAHHHDWVITLEIDKTPLAKQH